MHRLRIRTSDYEGEVGFAIVEVNRADRVEHHISMLAGFLPKGWPMPLVARSARRRRDGHHFHDWNGYAWGSWQEWSEDRHDQELMWGPC